jgi:CDP-diacylglycerol--glycerol-3-phosphate 3-phosphatidyltransferase
LRDTLRREWALLTGAGVAVLSAEALLLPLSLAGSLPVWAWCSWHLYRGLPGNRRNGEVDLLPGLGAPTRITMLRGVLVATVAGFLRVPAVAAPTYTAAAILDAVDGRAARRTKRETILGSNLDMEVDAAGILVASVSGIVLGKLPLAYAAIGLARYVFVLGSAVRRRRGRPLRDLDPSRLRRLLAGFQMGFLATALWPQVPDAVSTAAAYPFGAASLLMFARDWLYVSHRLRGAR